MGSVYVMWIREVKQYWRSKPRMLGSIAQPLLFLVALGFGLGPVFQQAGQGNYIQFLVPGIIAMTVLFGSVFNGISVIWDRQFGFLKESLVAPVSRTGLMVGRSLGGSTIATAQGIFVLFISFFLGFRPLSVVGIFLAIGVMFLTAFLFNLVGTSIASKLEDMQAFHLIMTFLVMPLFFLSGALFPVEGLGAVLTNVVKFNPLSYCVDALRELLVGITSFGMVKDIIVLSVLSFIVLFIGKYLFSRIEA